MEYMETLCMDRTRAVIDLGAIRNNYRVIRETFPQQKIMSVLKADAYGHGISGIAAVCDELTDQFAVATVEEGRRLREAGAKKPILLFGPVPEGRITEAAELGLTFSVGSFAYAMLLKTVLAEAGLQADCQLKIDTGFNRTGFRFRDPGKQSVYYGGKAVGSAHFAPSDSELAFQQMQMVFRFRELTVTGMYTHLPVPESEFGEDEEFTRFQIDCLKEAVYRCKLVGCDPGLVHAYSTGGALKYREQFTAAKPSVPEGQASAAGTKTEASEKTAVPELFDMVRVGMMVYGQCDTLEHYHELGLRQALRWSANLINTVELAEGETVGYGRTFTAGRPTLLGVVSAGYADGYRRCYQGLEVLCGGKRVPIVGRICMDFLMIDLTDVEEAETGMEVVLLGTQTDEYGKTEEITAIDIARARESTCGEVTAAINERVPRYYVESMEEFMGPKEDAPAKAEDPSGWSF